MRLGREYCERKREKERERGGEGKSKRGKRESVGRQSGEKT